MIIFSAIVPHSPLLLPKIGKGHRKKLARTLEAYKTLEEQLYASKPDTLVVLTPHGAILPHALALFIASAYRTNLKEFGDTVTNLEFKADLRSIEALRKLRQHKKPVPIAAVTCENIDYGTAVPLYFLTPHLPNIRIVPIGSSALSLRKHFDAGAQIGDILQQTTRRIALIASADLAHTLTENAPGGFSTAGKKFDEAVVQALRKKAPTSILKLEAQAESAKACGLQVIAMLLGAMDDLNYAVEPLAYEGPFGVGYLALRYLLH